MADYRDFQNASLDLYVDQGSDFMQIVNLKDFDGNPLDLTDYSVSISIKKYYNVSFIYPSSVFIVGNPLAGTIRIEIPKSTTDLFNDSRYVYLVRINNSTDTVKVLDGQILVDRF